MHIYCLFCQTQKTEQIAQFIEKYRQDVATIRCISPKIVQRCWVQGREELRTHKYLPGYVFVYSAIPMKYFNLTTRINGVIRILGQKEEGYELTGDDRSFAQMIYDMDGTIGIVKTLQIGDRVVLDSSLYRDFTGEIIKLDRRKGRAQIRFEFDGSTQNVWVGYETVKQAEDPATQHDAKAGQADAKAGTH